MADKLMLVDGNSIMNRAFYGVPTLNAPNGEPSNAIYGFLNIFFKLTDTIKPVYCIVCFDEHAPTFRHKMYAEYKGTRKAMPDELRPQMPAIKKILASMNITTCSLAGYEADDLLGTLAKKGEQLSLSPVIVSGDRDLLQIAGEDTEIIIPSTKNGSTIESRYFAKDVLESKGVTPEEFIHVKALMGDSSDNVPGVPSIGEKTATKIIQEYKTVENAIENADKIKPPKAAANLIQYKEQALLSKTLVTIKTDVPLELDISECKTDDMFNQAAYTLFKEYGLKSHLNRFEIKKTQNENGGNFTLIKTAEELSDCLSALNPFEPVAYNIFPENGKIYAFSFSQGEQKAFTAVFDNMEEALVPFFESDTEKIARDAKTDIVFLAKKGINLKGIIFDTMLAGYVVASSMSDYNYDDLAEEFLNESYPSKEEVLGKGAKERPISSLSENELLNYCSVQSLTGFLVFEKASERLEADGLSELYRNIELPLIYPLADMEITGMFCDSEKLKEYSSSLDEKLSSLTQKIYADAGEEFNINSPKQLGVILFEKLALNGGKKTKTGWSTSADILDKMAEKFTVGGDANYEIVSLVLEYRTYAKLKSTYCDGLLAVTDEKGIIHSTFKQTVATTGRISSTEPNLQNIPVRLELGRQLRKVFTPRPGNIFLDADYSQIELRVMAQMSGDTNLINAFKENKDIHTITAVSVFGVDENEVTSEQRRAAKAVNFGIIYGISAFGLSKDIDITKVQAQYYIDSYFKTYPGVKKFMDKCVDLAKERGYAVTLFGRRRYIPEITSSNFMQRSFGERVAMNMPVQGTAADIIKTAMIKVRKRLLEEGCKAKIVLQVHDELLLEAPIEEKEKVSVILREEMENAVALAVPLVAEVHEGKDWYEVK